MFSKASTTDDVIDDSAITSVKTIPSAGNIPSIIASDLKIIGNLVCGGAIEVEGEIEGNVTCHSVTVRKTGVVKGDMIAESIQVDGEINGLLKGREINLSETGRVTGVIKYHTLSVKDGAYIDGQCNSVDVSEVNAIAAIEASLDNDVAIKDEEAEAIEAA